MVLALMAKHKLCLRANFVAKTTWIGLGVKPDLCCGRSVTNHVTSGVDIVNVLEPSFVNC